MAEHFYVYYFIDKHHTKITIVPEQEFPYRLTRLRDLEGRLTTKIPIPTGVVNDVVDVSQKEKLEHDYKGKFAHFKREVHSR